MFKLVVCLKSGKELAVICEDCVIKRNGLGQVVSIEFKGVKNVKPLILDPTNIELMYEVLDSTTYEDAEIPMCFS